MPAVRGGKQAERLIAMEKITIVMPVYNPGEHLRPCIESVLNQTFADFCLLAIDDGSSDGSAAILQEYAAKDSRIVLLHNRNNMGAARTRNRGLAMARGKYLAVLDADDWYDAQFLQRYYEAAEASQADLVFGNMVILDMQTGEKKVQERPQDIVAQWAQGFCPRDFGKFLFQMCFVSPQAKLIRRSHIQKYQLRFQDLPNSNDVYFGLSSLALANRAIYIAEPLVTYRDNQTNSISAGRFKNPHCIFEAVRLVREKLVEHNCFAAFRVTYYTYVIINLLWTMNQAEAKIRQEMVQFMQQSGLAQLGMKNLTEQDFLQPDDYKLYQGLLAQETAKQPPCPQEDIYELLPFLDTMLLYGLRFLHDGRYPEALEYLRKWYHLRTTYYLTVQTVILHHLSQACYGAGDYQAALDYEQQYVTYAAQDEEAWLHLGNIKFRLEDYQGAVDAYARAIDRQADFTEAIVNLCLTLKAMGLEKEAAGFAVREDIRCAVQAGKLCEYRLFDLQLGSRLDYRDFPIFINARDRLGSLQQLVTWLQNAGYRHIYILDNGSTYPPLLAYYQELAHTDGIMVYPLGQNMGHTALWDSSILEKLHIRTPYVYTDPDIIPVEDCPQDIVRRCFALLQQNPFCVKAGPGIVHHDLTFDQAAEKEEWEKQFYRVPVGDDAYFAPLDTTFALYRNVRHYTIYTSIRTAGTGMIRHLPWYYTEENLPADEDYYRQHVNSSSTQWWKE